MLITPEFFARAKNVTVDEAQVINYLAEAEKFSREAEQAEAERDLKAAEARKMAALAAKEEFYAANAKIGHDQTKRQEDIALAANHHHHVFEFLSSVYDEPVQSCLMQMAVWDRHDSNCDMHIVMNSPGGSVIDGMHLFDQIIAYSKRPWDTKDLIKGPRGTHNTTISVRGYAASMAGILLQAADKRVIGSQSYLMIHEVSTFAHGKIGEIKDEVDFIDKISDKVTDLFVRRSNGKMTPTKFKKLWDRKDVWLTAEEALGYGFVDEIG